MKSTSLKNRLSGVKPSRQSYWLVFALITLSLLMSLASSPGMVGRAQTLEPAAPAAGTCPDPVWSICTVVDGPKTFYNMTNRSFRFDTLGNPHIAYGADHLYYIYWNGSAWVKEVVDSNPGVGQYASLALDSSNRPFISYYDSINNALKFAYKVGGVWYLKVLDTAPIVDAAVTSANQQPPDSDSTVAATQQPPTAEEAAYQQFLEAIHPDRWLNPLVQQDYQGINAPQASVSAAGKYSSIAVDNNNQVHITYYFNDGAHGVLKYAFWDTVDVNSWQIAVIFREDIYSVDSDTGRWTSLAVDSQRRAHVSFMSEKHDWLMYLEQSKPPSLSNPIGVWESTPIIVDPAMPGTVGPFTSLALDVGSNSSIIPHISYYDFSNQHLKHASRNGGAYDDSWKVDVVDNSADVGWDTSIAINANHHPVISYYDHTNGDLKLATWNGSNWNKSTLYSSGNVGRFTSIAIKSNNQTGISAFSPDTGLLQFFYYNGSQWSATNLDTSGDVGVSTSLVVNNSGFPSISYFSEYDDNLKFATGFNNSWNIAVLDSTGSVGLYTSVKTDSFGYPRIAYYDATNGDLKYAYYASNGWNFQVVDNGGTNKDNVGLYPSLAIDSLNRSYISYYDATNGNLKFAYNTGPGTAWVVNNPVDSTGDTGLYTSLALYVDPFNNILPRISFARNTVDKFGNDVYSLKYAYRTALNAWIVEVVDNTNSVGQYTSLDLDTSGYPHISYYDVTNGDLRYAEKTTGVWRTWIVDQTGDVGRYSSLALDSFNTSYISYYDVTNGDLKFAKASYNAWDTPFWTLSIVDALGDVGRFSSLALDPNGKPAISYYDYTNGDLKFVAQFNLPLLNNWIYLPLIRR